MNNITALTLQRWTTMTVKWPKCEFVMKSFHEISFSFFFYHGVLLGYLLRRLVAENQLELTTVWQENDSSFRWWKLLVGFPQECHRAGLMLFVIAADRTPFGKEHLGFWPFPLTEVAVYFFVSMHNSSDSAVVTVGSVSKPQREEQPVMFTNSHIITDNHYVGFKYSAWLHENYTAVIWFISIHRKMMAGVLCSQGCHH